MNQKTNILTRIVLTEKAPFWIKMKNEFILIKVKEASYKDIDYMNSLPGDSKEILEKGKYYIEVEVGNCHLIPKEYSIKI